MRRVRLGRSKLEVMVVGMGGIPIQRPSGDEAVLIVRRAVDRGCNWIDTANGYSTSEERIGRAIKEYKRESLHLLTKGAGKEPEEIRGQIELSLRRLETPYLDLYQFHLVPSPEKWAEMKANGTVAVVVELKQKGIIRHIGASAHNPETALNLAQDDLIEVIQFPLNFIMEEDGQRVLQGCRERDVGFIAMKPFGGGMLEKASPCIRFLLQYSGIATDPGFASEEEVDEVIDLAEEGASLNEQDRSDIERLKQEVGKSFCRRCGYCSPCEQGVDIMILMNMESLIKRFSREKVIADWTDSYKSLESCTECGSCEEKCPYELPIRERIRTGAETFRRAAGL